MLELLLLQYFYIYKLFISFSKIFLKLCTYTVLYTPYYYQYKDIPSYIEYGLNPGLHVKTMGYI